MTANLLLRSVRKRLADWLIAEKEKRLRDKRATVPDLTTLENVSDLRCLNDIPGLIEDLQAEMVCRFHWSKFVHQKESNQ